MTVSIAGQVLDDLENLSPKARALLGFIRGGKEWLSWAIEERAERYAFADQKSMVEAIQSGLHGDEALLLPRLGLEVSLLRLWQLDLETLETLAAATGKGGRTGLQTRKTLAAANLWTAEELANGLQFLQRLGVDDEPVFQATTLADQIALFNLGDSSVESEEAAQFAVAGATSPIEFVDLYELYLAVAEAPRPKQFAVGDRVSKASAVLEPLVWGLLRCPFAPQDLTCAAAGSLVRAWFETAAALGFATAALGRKEIAAFARGEVADDASARRAVESYIDRARSLLVFHDPYREELTQDGSVQLFRVGGDGASAVLARHRLRGTLTLRTLSTH